MGKTASKKKGSAVAPPSDAIDGADASALAGPTAGESGEPLERARLQAEVARQRVRIAKEELKRARKRVKEAKREAKRARKQAYATRKVWKKARKAHRANTAPEGSTGAGRRRTPQAQTPQAAARRAAKRSKTKSTRRRQVTGATREGQADGSAPTAPSSET
jgi:hypothetical protein